MTVMAPSTKTQTARPEKRASRASAGDLAKRVSVRPVRFAAKGTVSTHVSVSSATEVNDAVTAPATTHAKAWSAR